MATGKEPLSRDAALESRGRPILATGRRRLSPADADRLASRLALVDLLYEVEKP